MYSGLSISKAYGGITVSVILEAATGAIELDLTFFFSPSLAQVIVNPWIPNLAAA